MSHFKSTVECYDCHQQVRDLKSHRSNCVNSKKTKCQIKDLQADFKTNVAVSDSKDRYFLFDTSGSMTGTRIESAKSTALELFDAYPENDRIAVITFDTTPYFRLKPRPVGQIRRQNELSQLFSRFKTEGNTSIWDSIFMAVNQIRGNPTVILNTITDGEDNSSVHTYKEVVELIAKYPNVTLNIIHVSDKEHEPYKNVCAVTKGIYKIITEIEIKTTMKIVMC